MQRRKELGELPASSYQEMITTLTSQVSRFVQSNVKELVATSPKPTADDADLLEGVRFVTGGDPHLEVVRAQHPVEFRQLLSSSLPYTFRETPAYTRDTWSPTLQPRSAQTSRGHTTHAHTGAHGHSVYDGVSRSHFSRSRFSKAPPRPKLVLTEAAKYRRDVMADPNASRAEIWRAHYNDLYSSDANAVRLRARRESSRARDEAIRSYAAVLDRPPPIYVRARPPESVRSSTPPPAKPKIYAAPLASLRPELPGGWAVPEVYEDAIDEFERRQQSARTDATRALAALLEASEHGRGDNPRFRAQYSVAVRNVALNRFVVREHVEEVVIKVAEKPKAKVVVERWNLSMSVWAEREKRCDARDFYDTPNFKTRVVELLWDRALRVDECRLAGYLKWILERSPDGVDKGGAGGEGGADRPASPQSPSGGPLSPGAQLHAIEGYIQTSEELREVCGNLSWYCDVMWNLYDYYSVSSISKPGFKHELAIGGVYPSLFIEKNEYQKFVEHLELTERNSQHRSKEHFAQLFLVVNTSSSAGVATAEPKCVNPNAMLNRREWMEMLVRVCVMRYVQTGEMSDVSDALGRLLAECEAKTPKVAHQDSNLFRRELMYTEGVDAILRKNLDMLRAIFDAFAYEEKPNLSDEPNPFATKEGLSWDNWLQLVDAFAWLDRTFTSRDAGNVYVWSRMWAFDDGSVAARRKVTNLWFEDFLEAVVRVATMKSLPDMQEVIYAGFSDCGEYLMELKATGEKIELRDCVVSAAYDKFCQEHPASWDKKPSMDTEDLVEHMCMFIKRTIETKLGKPTSGKELTKREIMKFRMDHKDQSESR